MPEITIRGGEGMRGRFPLAKERVTIGRSRESDIFLPDQWLSRHHAEIRRQGETHLLVDLGSKNGTLLNGTKIMREEHLKDGDVITLGEHTLTFHGDGVVQDDPEPMGTRVFSARELSDIKTKPNLGTEDLVRQNRLLGVLNKAAQTLIEHHPLSELFGTILNLVFSAVPAERGAILLLEGDPPEPVVKASLDRKGGTGTSMRVSRSIARRAIQDRVSILLPNVMSDLVLKEQESILASGVRSALCAPLWFNPPSGPDEVIGLLYLDSVRGSFSDDDVNILTALANVAAAKIENARLLEESLEKRRLEQDIQMAAQIQQSLLPLEAPRVPGYDVVGCNVSCRTVGGDYFDFGLEEGHLLLALGDVSGKGTAAALLMTVLRSAVRGHWTDPRLSEGIQRINRTVCQNVPEGKYVTFFLARLDPATGRLHYVNAGHNPPLLVRADGSVETLTEGGMVLGLMESVPYEEGRAELRTGDTLMVFSDGLTETLDPQGEEFGDKGLTDLVVHEHARSAIDLQARVFEALDGFAKGAKAGDDRTLIILKRIDPDATAERARP